jgi:hypothetical protein
VPVKNRGEARFMDYSNFNLNVVLTVVCGSWEAIGLQRIMMYRSMLHLIYGGMKFVVVFFYFFFSYVDYTSNSRACEFFATDGQSGADIGEREIEASPRRRAISPPVIFSQVAASRFRGAPPPVIFASRRPRHIFLANNNFHVRKR